MSPLRVVFATGVEVAVGFFGGGEVGGRGRVLLLEENEY